MSFRRIAIVNRGDAASRCLRAIQRAARRSRSAAHRDRALHRARSRARRSCARRTRRCRSVRRCAARAARPPRLAYLDRARVLAALRATRADSVWPGWGFLAEDAAFVEQLEQRGIAFIGPTSAAMRALGDKIAAKRLAESCGVPVAPWSGGGGGRRHARRRRRARSACRC